MNYDDPFSRDPVIRLRQVKKAMAELLELGHIRQAGVDEKGRPLYELTDAGRASHASDKARLH
jgi:chromosome segregation and condensation protein ScpB